MNVLVVGSGGREHALCWKLNDSARVDRILAAPGNGGTAREARNVAVKDDDIEGLIALAKAEQVGLVVVGPEAPLVLGLADALAEAGIPCFGPSAFAAQLEGSKAFAKNVMRAANVPTADFQVFDDPEAARDYIRRQGAPLVVKADGLAAGKGVVVAKTVDEALAAIDDMMIARSFGAAGARVVVEQALSGEEASFLAFCDGENYALLPSAQDHKAVGEGDTGPNTGGMGAYSPAPVLTDALMEQALDRIVRPTVAEMARRGTPYQGVLYAGLMIEGGQARLVEYNVRFGDPECQVLMLRLGAQALDLLLACAEGRLADARVNWADDHALTVVLAAKGYPGDYAKGSAIRGLDALTEDTAHMVFHAGTAARDGQIVANGGRVLNVTARGATLAEARDRAYGMVDAIDWPEGFCRRDIGWRAL